METYNKSVNVQHECSNCNGIDTIRFLKGTHYCSVCREIDHEIVEIKKAKHGREKEEA